MRIRSLAAGLAVFVSSIVAGIPALASFHLWVIEEVYTNSDGSVQFIELFTSFSGEQFLSGHTITSSANTFTFPSNSPAPTGNHHLLVATADFGSLAGGVPPDFTLPSNFFDPAGDTINFAGVNQVTFASAPTDGITSLNYPGGNLAANSPTNFAGAAGSIDLSPTTTGDYNGDGLVDAADYTVWRDTFGLPVGSPGDGADGDLSGTIDDGDYTFWKEHFGDVVPGAGGGATAVPEPSAIVLAVLCLPLLCRLPGRKPCFYRGG